MDLGISYSLGVLKITISYYDGHNFLVKYKSCILSEVFHSVFHFMFLTST